jgi:hypothetical protein
MHKVVSCYQNNLECHKQAFLICYKNRSSIFSSNCPIGESLKKKNPVIMHISFAEVDIVFLKENMNIISLIHFCKHCYCYCIAWSVL